MPDLTPEALDLLEALARAATEDHDDRERLARKFAYVHAANPSAILALIAEVRRLTEENTRLSLSDDYMPEGVDIIMNQLRTLRIQIKRVRETAERIDERSASAILQALDGGDH